MISRRRLPATSVSVCTVPLGQRTSTRRRVLHLCEPEMDARDRFPTDSSKPSSRWRIPIRPSRRRYATTAPTPSPVRARATQRYRQPVIGIAAVVAQDRRLGVEIGDDDVDVPVIIDIAEGSAAAGGRSGECRPERRGTSTN